MKCPARQPSHVVRSKLAQQGSSLAERRGSRWIDSGLHEALDAGQFHRTRPRYERETAGVGHVRPHVGAVDPLALQRGAFSLRRWLQVRKKRD